jgi:signal transduction histidine kinase/CheY-like chemotaxis protein
MEHTRHLDVLVVHHQSALFQEFRKIFSSAPDITALYAATLGDALHMLYANNIGCVICEAGISRQRGYEWRHVIREIKPAIPVLLYRRNKSLFPARLSRRLKKEGVSSILPEPLEPEAVLDAVRRAGEAGFIPGSEAFQEQLASPLDAVDRYTLLQTALDILSHDTRDLFIRILSILSDIPENEYTGILNDYVNELFECTSEALGFITAQKRLESLIDIVNAIRIGHEKIPLPSHSRIELTYAPRKLLFIETSRLLKNALGNIIDNALKYSPPATAVRLQIARRGEDILFTVTDRGIGIPKTERSRVCERYYRSANVRNYEGSGKGLWIASAIVKEEHGDIEIRENPEGGTIVTVRLPAFALTASERRLADLSDWFKLPLEVVEKKARIMKTLLLMEFPSYEPDSESLVFANLLDHFRDERRKRERQKYFYKLREFTQYNPTGPTVLLVDDSLYVHYSIAPLLADQGLHIVDFAFNGLEAFNLYRIFTPALIIMDITMPVKSGIETAQDIYKMNPDAKILFVTALGEYKPLLENIDRLFQGRQYRVLTKPIRPLKLTEMVSELIGTRP